MSEQIVKVPPSDRLNHDEKERICELYFDQGKTQSEIARLVGRSITTVNKTINTFRPDVKLAARLLKANTLTLVERVIARADVDQAVDILSRPNIGILQPALKSGASQGTGVYISVSSESCSAVVAVNTGQSQEAINEYNRPQLLPRAKENAEQGIPELPAGHGTQGVIVSAGHGTTDAAEERNAGQVVPRTRHRPRHVTTPEGEQKPLILPFAFQ